MKERKDERNMSMKDYVDRIVKDATDPTKKKTEDKSRAGGGVDEAWILDSRTALGAMIGRGALDTGELNPLELSELAAFVADAMAMRRTERGGVKKAQDPLEEFLKLGDKTDLIQATVEKIVEALSRGAGRGEAAARKAKKKEN